MENVSRGPGSRTFRIYTVDVLEERGVQELQIWMEKFGADPIFDSATDRGKSRDDLHCCCILFY